MWQSWLSAVVGVALVIVALLATSFGPSAVAWLTGIGGAVVAVLSFWVASQKR